MFLVVIVLLGVVTVRRGKRRNRRKTITERVTSARAGLDAKDVDMFKQASADEFEHENNRVIVAKDGLNVSI